jgi:hypothetical protein
MPLEGERLVIEPRYPNAQALMAMCGGRDREEAQERDPDLVGARVRNTFYSMFKQSEISVIEKADGSITWGLTPAMHHLQFSLQTLGCSDAWGLEQESKALELLGELVEHRKFKQYLLTGSFLERSKRSGVYYFFRRLKPTVAIRTHGTRMEIMCALCLHPIGLYQGTWSGVMCPTDDVIAHLQLMRGDEHLLWRKANQHPSWLPQAGI